MKKLILIAAIFAVVSARAESGTEGHGPPPPPAFKIRDAVAQSEIVLQFDQEGFGTKSQKCNSSSGTVPVYNWEGQTGEGNPEQIASCVRKINGADVQIVAYARLYNDNDGVQSSKKLEVSISAFIGHSGGPDFQFLGDSESVSTYTEQMNQLEFKLKTRLNIGNKKTDNFYISVNGKVIDQSNK